MEMDNDNVLNRRTERVLNLLNASAENGVEEISKLERAWLIFIPLDSKRVGWGLGLNVKTSETMLCASHPFASCLIVCSIPPKLSG